MLDLEEVAEVPRVQQQLLLLARALRRNRPARDGDEAAGEALDEIEELRAG